MKVRKYLKALLISSNYGLNSIGLFILRIGTSGLMISLHGWPKLKDFSEIKTDFPELIGLSSETGLILAVFAEIFCSILLSLGILTRIVAIPLLITMFVAAFIFNAEQVFIVKEKGVLFMMVFLFFIIVGAGKFSVDHYFIKTIA